MPGYPGSNPYRSLSSCVALAKLLHVSEPRLHQILEGAAEMGVGTLGKPFTHSLEHCPAATQSATSPKAPPWGLQEVETAAPACKHSYFFLECNMGFSKNSRALRGSGC